MEEPGRLHIVHGVTKSWTRLNDFTFIVILFLVFEESPYCFPWQLHNFTFLSTVHKDFNLSISLTFVFFFFIVFILMGVYRRETMSHCGFDLHFSN